MMRRVLLLVSPLALSACGSAQEETVEQDDPAADTVALAERFDDTVILVHSNGVGPKDEDLFRFGAERGEVDAALADAFGSEAREADCRDPGAGDMRSSDFGPLQVVYEDDRMVGWLLKPGRKVATTDGIRPGTSTYSDLRTERPVRRINATYPGGFEYTSADFGTIGGSVDGDRITLLTAGLNCPVE